MGGGEGMDGNEMKKGKVGKRERWERGNGWG